MSAPPAPRAADLSAYPIIRTDEISYLPDDPSFFTTCTRDVYALIESIKGESDPDRGLIEYLLKQIELLRKEQVKRNAARRIEALLRGEVVDTPSYDAVAPPQVQSRGSQEADASITTRPSGSEDSSKSNSATLGSAKAPGVAAVGINGPVSQSCTNDDSSSVASAPARAAVAAESMSSSSVASPPLREVRPPVYQQSESNIAASNPIIPRRRPTEDGVLSAKVQESLNRSFGVEFVVAPVEKKKRFYMKKKVEVDPEEALDNNRQERRKAAMQRLMDRQKERQERRAAHKAKVQKEKAAAKTASRSASTKDKSGNNNDNPFVSSDSESISGADDVSDDDTGGRGGRDVMDIIKENYNDSCNASRLAQGAAADDTGAYEAIKSETTVVDAGTNVTNDNNVSDDLHADRDTEQNLESLNLQTVASPQQGAELSSIGAEEESDCATTNVNDVGSENAVDMSSGVVLASEDQQKMPGVWEKGSKNEASSDDDEEIGYDDDIPIDGVNMMHATIGPTAISDHKASDYATAIEDQEGRKEHGSQFNVPFNAIDPPYQNAYESSFDQKRGNVDEIDHDSRETNEGKVGDEEDDDDDDDDDEEDDNYNTGSVAARRGPRSASDTRGIGSSMRSSASSDSIAKNPRRRMTEALPVSQGASTSRAQGSSRRASAVSSNKSSGSQSASSLPQVPRSRGAKSDPQQIPVDPNYKCPYESFDMIFSGNYGPDGKLRAMRKGESFIATSTYQMMVQMLGAYTEWLEIMEDYSTVFSLSEPAAATSANSSATVERNQSAGRLVYSGDSKKLHYRIKSSRSDVCHIIHDVFQQMLADEYVELPSGYGFGVSWNLLWSWGRPKLNFSQLLVWQKVNHFSESRQLTRKDLLKKNLQSLTDMGRGRKSGEYFEIMPPTYLLPNEFTTFVKAFHEIEQQNSESGKKDANIWIMKPVGLSRGRGISLVTDVNTLQYSQASVIQQYIRNPLLLGGYKFDLRLYVLVTSVCPLEAFIYTEGFARLSTHKFTLDPQELGNKFIHLTNSSIQKQNTSGPTKDNPLFNNDDSVVGGSKMSLHGEGGLWNLLTKLGLDSAAVWENIKELVIKSLVAVEDKMTFQPNCFEVFGFDVLIDEDLRPWLIEVNASPSLSRDNPLDFRVKNAMIYDTIKLIDAAPFDRAALVAVLKRRLQAVQANPGITTASGISRNDPRLASDMYRILGDYVPRTYGEMPKHLGSYERLCPNNKVFERALAMKSKIFRSGPNASVAKASNG